MQREALVAIIGEPNVGKSTMLNKITSERQALTSAVAGTTRDRFYATTSWNGVDFTLVDTAGIILEQRDELEINVQKQVQIALEQADLILYLVDGKKNPESFNRNVLAKIRKQSKPVILAVNKIDSAKKLDQATADYAFTGIKKIFACSAVSGVGIGDLLDGIAEELKKQGFSKIEKDPSTIAVSILGKPNVGKSSLFNRVVGEERVVVSNVPGTTRNVVDTDINFKDKKITLLDTAGLKRKEKRAPLPDIYAAFQTIRALHRSDICILVIDGKEGITQQDQKIAGEIVNANKGLIVAVNKKDLLSEDEQTFLEKNLWSHFPFLWWTPAVPISAKTGEGVEDILNYLITITENRARQIDDQTLTAFLDKKIKQNPPKRVRDERPPKIYSIRQIDVDPPVFEMPVNKPSAISMQFRKFLENSIIKELNFWGTPIKLKLIPKVGNPNTPTANVPDKGRKKSIGGSRR